MMKYEELIDMIDQSYAEMSDPWKFPRKQWEKTILVSRVNAIRRIDSRELTNNPNHLAIFKA